VTRSFAAATLCGLLLLTACSPGGSKPAASADPNVQLEPLILAWRSDLEATHTACATKVEGKGCDSFEVTCKASQEISADEKAKGITDQVVASMTFNGRSAAKAGSAFALFSKADGKWTRAEAPPVNMSTCAPM